MQTKLGLSGTFKFVCVDKDGALKWIDYADNMVVNVGLQYALDVIFKGSAATQIDPWYLGLSGATPVTASADTASVHAGWTEFLSYADNRKVFVDARTNQSVTNSASAATFVVSTAGTVGGAFLQSTATGSAGTLLSGAALTGSNRTVVADDTITLTYTFSGSSS